MSTSPLWPRYDSPDDLAAIEAVPLAERGLPATTYELLRSAAERRPEHVALDVMPDAARWRDSVATTYAELLADVHRTANVLHSVGVGRGDAVTLLSPNCAALIPTMLAAQLAGIAAPVNHALAPDHVRHLVRLSGSRVLVAAGPELDPGVWRTVEALTADGLVDTVLVLRPTGTTGEPPAVTLPGVDVSYLAARTPGESARTFTGIPPEADDIAALFHTGGTTGAPKLAAHTHRGEVSDAWMLAANGLLGPDARLLAALPLFHVNALVVTLLAPLFKAQTAVWAGPLGYRDVDLYGCFWQVVEHHRISTMSAVPTVYSVLAQVPVTADISSLRFAMVGASALPDAVRSDFESRTGVPLVEGYGLTEATCASVRSFPGAPRRGSVGQRMPYQRLKTVRVEEDGSWVDLPRGQHGVLAISGPTVFAGYVVGHGPDGLVLDAGSSVVDGWLDTGDLAWIDDDDFVHLTGRAKDLIIRGGHNINPATVEEALLSHPSVTGAGVVGEPDEHAGEVPVAFVTLSQDTTEDELLAWASTRVAERAAAPRRVTVLDALPVTDVGKPFKLELRARAVQRAVAARLDDVPGLLEVRSVVEDGIVVAVVSLESTESAEAIGERLARLDVPTRIEAAS
ncbi:acyl-CoA synthetase [Nocardioides plantarum]|uniref:Acyl-CoA synthetase n=1 Tax=Nocardioides plantarum TaxID=29299 RepID=A0ABV5K9Y2_9ACTN|nr:acyl-CoA synthetase [Nocardioides plantarum]